MENADLRLPEFASTERPIKIVNNQLNKTTALSTTSLCKNHVMDETEIIHRMHLILTNLIKSTVYFHF